MCARRRGRKVRVDCVLPELLHHPRDGGFLLAEEIEEIEEIEEFREIKDFDDPCECAQSRAGTSIGRLAQHRASDGA